MVLADTEDPFGSDKPADKPAALRALAELERAKVLGLETRALHRRRAVYLDHAGEDSKREQKLAEACPIASGFDQLLIGQEQFANGRADDALKSFAAALRMEQGDYFWAWYYQALCYLRLEKMDLARDSLTAALSHKGNVVWPYLQRGFANGQLHAWDAAEADFDSAEKLLQERDDKDARYVLLNNRAVVHLGRLAQVRKDRVLSEEAKLKLFEVAMGDLDKAVKLKPEQYHAFVTRAQGFADAGKPDDAVREIDEAIKRAEKEAKKPDSLLALLYRNRARWQEVVGSGDQRRAQESVAAALDSLRRAAEWASDTEKAQVLAESGRIKAHHRRFAEAVADYDQALRLNKNNADVLKAHAECLLKLARWADALRDYDELLSLGAGVKPEMLARRAMARLKSEPPDKAGALADLTLALAREPGNAAYRAQRGQLYLGLEQYLGAVADFDEVLARERSAHALLGRGLARASLGDHAGAAADAEEASKKDLTQLQRYSAGAVFSLAVGVLDSLKRPLTLDEARARLRYQERALALVKQSLLDLPEEQRASFWKSHPARDRSLAPLRPTPDFRELQQKYATRDVASPG